jgi:aldehyde:ferredoxin oxidoreductase
MNTVIRVNTRTRQVTSHPVTDEETRWGGRSFIAHLLLREVPPTCEPTGRRNKLIVASGLLADTGVTTTGQLSIGGKSPLTGGVKECNTGGIAGKRLARLGIRALILEETPAAPVTDVVVIGARGSRLEPFPELKGTLVDQAVSMLRAKYGEAVGIICIGPAGEMMMYGAGLALPDGEALQIRYAARGGLGALMGSKGIKAIVIDDSDSPYRAEPHDPDLLTQTSRWMNEALKADPKTENRHLYGTDAILALANASGLLPTRNFSSGSFEKADDIAGERLRAEILARGGEGRAGTACVPGCVIQCCNVFPDKSGRKMVATIQYENISLLGSNCGIGDLDDIAEMNHLCNQVGVDAIETGAAIGVAMEAGILPFGDAEAAKDLIRQIGRGTYLGRILGHGAKLAGRVLGVRRIPVIKGQAIPGYDPRALKGNGVTYVTSPMGADHTAGNAFETLKTLNPLKPAGQVSASRKLQVRAALLDTLGLCLFVRPPFVKHPEMFANLLHARYGWEMKVRDVLALAHEVIMTEREFNRRAGASEEFHPMPEFMQDEPLPPNNVVFDVPMAEMQTLWDGYEPTDEF